MTSDKDIIKGLKQLYQSIKVDPVWAERHKAKLLAYYKEQFPSVQKDIFFYFKPVLVTIIVLFVFVASSGGLVAYAQKATPGDILYSFKRLTEQVVYQLTTAKQKPVLRAEMVERRINEVRVLAEKISPENLENQLPTIKKATQELEKEIAALKREIGAESETIVPHPDLAVRDNKKIVEIIKEKDVDLNKMLAATKEAIKENNLTAALANINEVEKIFSETSEIENTEEKAVTENNKPVSEPIESKESLIAPLPPEEKPLRAPVEIKPTSPDFKIEIERESKERAPADLIQE